MTYWFMMDVHKTYYKFNCGPSPGMPQPDDGVITPDVFLLQGTSLGQMTPRSMGLFCIGHLYNIGPATQVVNARINEEMKCDWLAYFSLLFI